MSVQEKISRKLTITPSLIMFGYKQLTTKIALFLFVAGIVILAYFLYGDNNKKTVFQSSPALPGRQLSSSSYPSQVVDLGRWKLTIPVTSGDGKLMDIRQPELATYQIDPWFMLTSDKLGVVFRAPVNAGTTANSDYPRSELREMTDDGTEEFFWPSTSGTHTLILEEAITAVPKHKPDVVAGQIHGDDDDLIVVRLEYPKLFLARGRTNLATLDENYTLGKRFTIKFVAANGQIKAYYNNGLSPVYTLDKKVNEAYFKAGAYTQSNCETEDSPDLCNANNYGEVVIYNLSVTHQQ